jgi:hypothetical protein
MKIKTAKMPGRQFVSLCAQSSLSGREIASRSGRHYSVVARVRNALSQGKIDLEMIQTMRESEIWATVTGKRGRQQGTFAEPEYTQILKKLAGKKYLKDELYCEYIEEFNGQCLMSLRTFYRRVEQVCSSPKVTMLLTHNPGEVMQSDFAGDKVQFLEKLRTVLQREMFITAVGVSGLIFIKSSRDQKTNSWIDMNNAALGFYGGVPPIWTMDNLKAAVLQNNAKGIILNPVFEAMGNYYSVSIQPARPVSPKDKAKAEASVKLAQRVVRRALRNTMPHSIEELDELLLSVAEAINNRPMRGHGNLSRRAVFEEIDRPALGPLPPTPFALHTVRRNVLVATNYRVTEGQITYSVPYQLVGKRVALLISDTHVTCVYDGQPVAVHQRGTQACQDVCQIEHMPQAHREYLKDPSESLSELAETLGPSASKFSVAAVDASPTPAGGKVVARKLRSIFKSFSPTDVENACEYALLNGIVSREGILTVLQTRIWTQSTPDDNEKPIFTHQNIRGEGYYRNRLSVSDQGGAV